ncbi:efflux RND transporter periplasmic adaptor subunit [Silvibacterium sp.]|uniref:efflux RND transporter periplasmic adaptor subunit n=1 Tax=Silvibacterium sp. TaxID=1964179 RepID=UPI0039E4D6F5
MSHRIRTLPLIVAASLCLLTISGCTRVSAKTDDASTTADVPVRATRAVVEDVPLEIAAVGHVEAIHSVDVKSRVAGPIARVAFTEGQSVSQGQLLFTIDRDVLDREAAEQQALIERDAALDEQAKAILARDAASEKQSQSEADVALKLGDLGVISGQRVSQFTTARDTAGASFASDQASLAAAEGTLRADRARLAELALQQKLTSIVAPISGRAGAVQLKAGNLVRDNDTTLVTLLQMAPIYVTFGLPEQSLAQVRQLNAQAPLAVQAGPAGDAPQQGRIAFIDNTVDMTTGAIRMKAVFPNADSALWPGEFVQVRVRLRTDAARVVIPDACVQNGQDGSYAWVIHENRATMTPVTVQRVYAPQNAPGLAVIASGIRAGDLVVTEGQLRITAGARVSLLDAPRS